MKIVQISSLWERTPPPKYGGLELVVSNLTEELIKRGHEVTLFATGDSITKAKLKSVYPRPLYRDGVQWSSMNDTLIEIAEAIKYAEEWGADVIHNHQSHRSLAMMTLSKTPFVNTIHGTLDPKIVPEDRIRTFKYYKNQNFVSISDFQRKFAPYLNWIRTVYNGIDTSRFPMVENPKGDYLVWIGRFTATKAPHLAIEVAKKLKMKIFMGAKLDKMVPKDLEYFETYIQPELKKGSIEWVGEVDHKGKADLYKNALAFLNPIQWDEPFGLVVVESMACGTPVISFERGAMRELIKDGETGFLIKPGDVNGMVKAVEKVQKIDRASCRRRVENNFSIEAMTEGYLAAYNTAIESKDRK